MIALPRHEFGLDVIALVGALRHREHRSVLAIHVALGKRGLLLCERSITNLLDRYDELVAAAVDAPNRAALPEALKASAAEHPDKRLRLYFQDEARVGQKGRLCHRWWLKGQRPSAAVGGIVPAQR